MKKYAVMLALAMLLGLYGCDSKAGADDTISSTGVQEGEEILDSLPAFDKSATIEQTVLYDENDVKITANELTYDNYFAEVSITIENNSNKTLSFSCGTNGYSCNVVNGIMSNEGYFHVELEPGTTTDEKPHFEMAGLQMSGINFVGSIGLAFEIEDEEYNRIYTSPCYIQTSLANRVDESTMYYQNAIVSEALQANYEYSVEYFGTESLFDNMGIEILSQTIITNKKGEHHLFVEFENQSDETVILEIADISFNGNLVYEYKVSDGWIAPGTKAVLDVNLSKVIDKEDVEDLALADIKSVGFNITLKDTNWEKILEDSPVTIELS